MPEPRGSVLVTGGAGYIGSHTAKALFQAGYRPIVYDDLSTGHQWAVRWGPFVEGNLRDRNLVRQTLEKYAIEAVIHFAANASVAESMVVPYKYLHDNIASSLELFEAMREAGVRHIVASSTCATYGVPDIVPIAETESQCPENPYGQSKLYVEQALKWYERAHDLKWVALRYFNAAGADPDGEIGEAHDPETHLLPLLVEAAMGKRGPVQLMGTDYPTLDGTAIRDYIHVADLADAHLKALEYLFDGEVSSAFNLGTGHGYSVRDAIAAVERVCGCRVPIREAARRPGDPPELVADSRKAMELLGWQPRYLELDEIVRTAWRWHTAQAVHCATATST